MMEIRINRTAEKELAVMKLLWKQFALKYCFFALIIMACGTIMLFAKVTQYGVEVPFWDLGSALGLAFVAIGILRAARYL